MCSHIIKLPKARLGWGATPEITHRLGRKVHLLMGMKPKLNIISNVVVGFTEYGVTNASNFKWGLPLPATSKCLRKGHPFKGMTQRIKTVIDCGIFLHETVLQHSKSTCTVMARDRLLKVCSSRGEQIHLVLDKYLSQLTRFRAKVASFRESSHIYYHWT